MLPTTSRTRGNARVVRKVWARLKHQAVAEVCARSRVDARTLLLEGPEGQSVALLHARAFGLNERSDSSYCAGSQCIRPVHFAFCVSEDAGKRDPKYSARYR